jgi:hypothetical protein
MAARASLGFCANRVLGNSPAPSARQHSRDAIPKFLNFQDLGFIVLNFMVLNFLVLNFIVLNFIVLNFIVRSASLIIYDGIDPTLHTQNIC